MHSNSETANAQSSQVAAPSSSPSTTTAVTTTTAAAIDNHTLEERYKFTSEPPLFNSNLSLSSSTAATIQTASNNNNTTPASTTTTSPQQQHGEADKTASQINDQQQDALRNTVPADWSTKPATSEEARDSHSAGEEDEEMLSIVEDRSQPFVKIRVSDGFVEVDKETALLCSSLRKQFATLMSSAGINAMAPICLGPSLFTANPAAALAMHNNAQVSSSIHAAAAAAASAAVAASSSSSAGASSSSQQSDLAIQEGNFSLFNGTMHHNSVAVQNIRKRALVKVLKWCRFHYGKNSSTLRCYNFFFTTCT